MEERQKDTTAEPEIHARLYINASHKSITDIGQARETEEIQTETDTDTDTDTETGTEIQAHRDQRQRQESHRSNERANENTKNLQAVQRDW